MTKERIPYTRIRELRGKITPPDWYIAEPEPGLSCAWYEMLPEGSIAIWGPQPPFALGGINAAVPPALPSNAEFIASSPAVVDQLLEDAAELERYVRHATTCEIGDYNGVWHECTCGLAAALARVK